MDAKSVGSAQALQTVRDLWIRIVRQLGWPVIAGVALLLLGGILLLGAHRLRQANIDLEKQIAQNQRSLVTTSSVTARVIPVSFPVLSTHTNDVAQIFDSAKEQGIALSSGEYQSADAGPLPIQVRLIDLRLNESYPKVKELLAGILNTMPHVGVHELRIERKDAASPKHQVFVKLALVYESESKTKAELGTARVSGTAAKAQQPTDGMLP